jgi:hypothetical protein
MSPEIADNKVITNFNEFVLFKYTNPFEATNVQNLRTALYCTVSMLYHFLELNFLQGIF